MFCDYIDIIHALPNLQAVLDYLSVLIPRKHTFVLRDLPVQADDRQLMQDYYFKSLVEQEICYRTYVVLK